MTEPENPTLFSQLKGYVVNILSNIVDNYNYVYSTIVNSSVYTYTKTKVSTLYSKVFSSSVNIELDAKSKLNNEGLHVDCNHDNIDSSTPLVKK